jgi:hypothetical protein
LGGCDFPISNLCLMIVCVSNVLGGGLQLFFELTLDGSLNFLKCLEKLNFILILNFIFIFKGSDKDSTICIK